MSVWVGVCMSVCMSACLATRNLASIDVQKHAMHNGWKIITQLRLAV